MYSANEVKDLCAELAEDLRAEHGDLEVADDGLSASIPYYSHGRMSAHTLDLELMAKTALIFARRARPTTDEDTPEARDHE